MKSHKKRAEATSKQPDRPAGRWGLVANGSCGHWDIAVNEALDRDEWSLEIDGPHAYLAFQIDDLKVVGSALRFLESISQPQSPSDGDMENGRVLPLGRFGPATVSLRCDDEDFARVFLGIGPEGDCTLLWALEGDDIRMVIEALRQVVSDIAD